MSSTRMRERSSTLMRSFSSNTPLSKLYAPNSRQVVFSSSTDPLTGAEIALCNREIVSGILTKLEKSIALPVARRFNLKYAFIGEHHPTANKAGVTYRQRIDSCPSSVLPMNPQYVYIIRVRIRSRSSPQRRMLTFATHVAILLHELAHLRHMNHGREFALFLRDIYLFADEALHIFDTRDLFNEIPSPWEWERKIWDSRGHLKDDELIELHQAWEILRDPSNQS